IIGALREVLDGGAVRLFGNVEYGTDITLDDLQRHYHAVIFATGAIHDATLDIPGIDLPGSYGAADLVSWYDGHPDVERTWPLEAREVAVIGNGNVALDVARILAKTRAEFAGSDIAAHALDALDRSAIRTVHVLGRRGPHQIAMTPKELGELGHLRGATPTVDLADFPPAADDALLEPGMRKSVTHLRDFAALPRDRAKTIEFDFFAMPVAIEGEGRVERVIVERTELTSDLRSVGTGERYAVDCGLVVSCIGYQTPPIEGVPYEHGRGRFANHEGVITDRLYCVGWARRGPTGTIGTNRPDGFEVAEKIAAAMPPGGEAPARDGGAGLDLLLTARGVEPVTFRDWQLIEAAEAGRAREGSPREKFTAVAEMLAVLGR
ncbi:MAG: ferredoxin/flavodoxin---NADP+ reductase, partial [Sphingomonadales bacterium]|nr:ferredoxin/flavodoxin---NADP+ reductase [Sphingomonadales bacterium]